MLEGYKSDVYDRLVEIVGDIKDSLSQLISDIKASFFGGKDDDTVRIRDDAVGIKVNELNSPKNEVDSAHDNDLSTSIKPNSLKTEKEISLNKYGFSLDGSEYSKDNSFTSRSGITYKLYDQTRGPWASYPYGKGKTMKDRGCMLTSAAVVASSLGNFKITPGDFYKYHKHESVSSSVPAMTNGKLKSKSIKTNNEIISGLQDGNPVIIKVEGKNRKGGMSKFTSSQHYMALLDITEDGSKVFIGNSHVSDGGNHASNGWYSTSEVLTSVREATVFSKV